MHALRLAAVLPSQPLLPSIDRTVLVLMALDANLPLLAIAAHGWLVGGGVLRPFLEQPALLAASLLFPLAFALSGLYVLRPGSRPAVAAIATALGASAATAAVLGLAHAFSAPRDGSLGLAATLGLLMGGEAVLTRGAVLLLRSRVRAVRAGIVVGSGWAGQAAIDTSLFEPRLRVTVKGMIDDDPLRRNFQYKGIPVLGAGDRLADEVNHTGARLVIVATACADKPLLVRQLLELKMGGVEVIDMPTFYERATGRLPIRHLEDTWFINTGGFELLHRPVLKAFKRACDVAVSATGLVFSLPLMGVIALLVKLDSRGPVLYRQERAGRNEKPFQLLKFRSMRADAEQETGPVWSGPRDYRVTRVGRLLRLSRLDELPQFINVLRGDMSLIGPRPERPFFVERLKKEIPYYALRFSVKPGLTGWAQVRYRYGASVEDALEKLKYDLYYIKNMSMALDAWIALKTLKVVLTAGGH